MKHTLFSLSAFIAAIAGAQGAWNIGGWNMAETEHGCGLGQVFHEGRTPTNVKVLLFVDGRAALVMKNDGWGLEEGRRLDLDLVLDDDVFSGPALVTSDHAIMVPLTDEVLAAFARSAFLTAFWNERPLENFPLDGSAAALASARECTAQVREEQERLARREERISPDPFSEE